MHAGRRNHPQQRWNGSVHCCMTIFAASELQCVTQQNGSFICCRGWWECTVRYLSLVTLTFKLVGARDQTRIPCEFGTNQFNHSKDIWFTNKKQTKNKSHTALKQNLTQFTVCGNKPHIFPFGKSECSWMLMKQGMIGCQWYKMDHTQIICTSLQTGNHARNSSLNFLQQQLTTHDNTDRSLQPNTWIEKIETATEQRPINTQHRVKKYVNGSHIPRCHLAFFSGAFLRSINMSGSSVGVVFISMHQQLPVHSTNTNHY